MAPEYCQMALENFPPTTFSFKEFLKNVDGKNDKGNICINKIVTENAKGYLISLKDKSTSIIDYMVYKVNPEGFISDNQVYARYMGIEDAYGRKVNLFLEGFLVDLKRDQTLGLKKTDPPGLIAAVLKLRKQENRLSLASINKRVDASELGKTVFDWFCSE